LNHKNGSLWLVVLASWGIAFKKVIPAVGRIEVDRHPTHKWLGTGWLVPGDIIVTNRHVAESFAKRDGEKFVFRQGADSSGKRMGARIDFHEEVEPGTPLEFQVLDILHIEEDGPDMAFLKVSTKSPAGKLAEPLQLAKKG